MRFGGRREGGLRLTWPAMPTCAGGSKDCNWRHAEDRGLSLAVYPQGRLGLLEVSKPELEVRAPAAATSPSLSSNTHHPAADRPHHRKSEKARVPGRRQAGEAGACSPGRSSSDAAGLRLPA